MTRLLPLAATAIALSLALPGCARGGIAGDIGPETRWRQVTTDQDRERLRNWRKAWVEALPAARAADNGVIAAQGALFEPDQAMTNAMPPAGDYRCRTYKLGAKRPGLRTFSALPSMRCRIGRAGDMPVFETLEGLQRPSGTLYAETDGRVIFLGALELGDETTTLGYGQDAKRDLAGYIERVGVGRWRLVLPWPSFESQLDVIELVPA